jgi:cob(I)alamin adenosyltransferase
VSIATKQGDKRQTSLPGGGLISKADLRVEAYGTIDELNATLAFARSICRNTEIASRTAEIQQSLFRLAQLCLLPRTGTEPQAGVSQENVDHLTDLIHAIEAQEGILPDWSLPGAHNEAAAFEVARTVCRRAERSMVRPDRSW